jgi:predicted  nucleic acid-binding Zn-ribbon protein
MGVLLPPTNNEVERLKKTISELVKRIDDLEKRLERTESQSDPRFYDGMR